MRASQDLIEAVQKLAGVSVDGDAGKETFEAIYRKFAGREWGEEEPEEPPIPGQWPLEKDAASFFGYPPKLTQIECPYPMRMFDSGKWGPIKKITCHAKVADSLLRILKAILAHYGSPEAVKAAGLDVYDGCYNDRNVRGSSTKRSMHAYGAAIDINAEKFPLGSTTARWPGPVVAIFRAEGWRYGGDYSGRKDPMHAEACR